MMIAPSAFRGTHGGVRAAWRSNEFDIPRPVRGTSFAGFFVLWVRFSCTRCCLAGGARAVLVVILVPLLQPWLPLGGTCACAAATHVAI